MPLPEAVLRDLPCPAPGPRGFAGSWRAGTCHPRARCGAGREHPHGAQLRARPPIWGPVGRPRAPEQRKELRLLRAGGSALCTRSLLPRFLDPCPSPAPFFPASPSRGLKDGGLDGSDLWV